MMKLFRFVVLPLAVILEIAVVVYFQFWLRSMPPQFAYGFVAGMLLMVALFAIIGPNG